MVFATTLDTVMPSADEYGGMPTDAAPVTSVSTLSPVYAVPDHPQRLRVSSGLQNSVEGLRVVFLVATLGGVEQPSDVPG